MKKAAKKLDQTQPGGYYIGANGKPHDAEGRPLPGDRPKSKDEPPAEQPKGKPEASPKPDGEKQGALPKDLPGRKALSDAGVDTWEALRSIAEVLTEVDGLDADTIVAIQAELGDTK